MPEYRRWRQPGGMFFFTVNLLNHRDDLLVRRIGDLRAAFARVRRKRPFTMEAAVVLPDHLHAIWTLPPGDTDYATRWRKIKETFTRKVARGERRSPSRRRRGERGIWQRRFYEHLIRDENDLEQHINYIHFNPVKHGWADRPVDWPYSSIHRFIRRGVIDAAWGTAGIDGDLDLD